MKPRNNLKDRGMRNLTFLGLLAICFLTFPTSMQGALTWSFSTTDGISTVAGTFLSDGSNSDLTGSGTHTFNVTELLTLNINGTDVTDPDIIGAPPRSAGEGTFQWDQVNQESTDSTSNWLILQKSGKSELLQIGHGQVTPSRHRTFTSSLTPSVDFVPNSTTYTPVPESEFYFTGLACLGIALSLTRKWSSMQSNSAPQRLSLVLLLAMLTNLKAATILTYEMEKSTITPTIAGNIVNANISADNLIGGSGLTPKDEGSGQFAFQGWTTDATAQDAIDANDFFQWGFDITGSIDLDLTSMDISLDRTFSGPDDFEIRASVNGGASSTVFTHDFNGSFGSAQNFTNIDLTGFASLQNLTQGDSVVFLLPAFSGSGTNLGIVNQGSFTDGDGLVINGDVTVVPEAEHYSLIFCGTLMGLGCLYRKKQRKGDFSR